MPIPNLKVSSQYIEWTLEANRGIMGHLYQFQSATGVNDYFTDLDVDITSFMGATWKSGSLRFEGMQRKIGIGLNVDEQTLKIWAAPTDTLFGSNFLTGAYQGLLNGAVITRFRAVWPFVTGNAATDVRAAPLAAWALFTGYTSLLPKGGASHIELKVKSALAKMNVNMPRNYYQPGCLWTLFDDGCTLHKAAFGVTGAVTSATALAVVISGGIVTPIGADGIANYGQGRLLFTSGVNSGLQVLIDTNDTTSLYLAYPLLTPPAPGDTVTFYPGCSKAYNTCDVKFNNKNNFRGFDKVPPVMLST